MTTFTKDESKMICRQFADKIFEKADTEDRKGGANKGTARTFYAAATFFEILKQFNEDREGESNTTAEVNDEQTEEDEKRVYCKWKATEILKALKEGRRPAAGGMELIQEGKEESSEESSAKGNNEEESGKMMGEEGTEVDVVSGIIPLQSQENGLNNPIEDGDAVYQPVPPPIPSAPSVFSDIPTAPALPPSVTSKKNGFLSIMSKSSKGAKKKVTKENITDAKELTMFALAALDDKDTILAVERLTQALQCLV